MISKPYTRVFGWTPDEWAYVLGWYTVARGEQPDDNWTSDDYLRVMREWRNLHLHEPGSVQLMDQHRNSAAAERLVELVHDMIYGVYA